MFKSENSPRFRDHRVWAGRDEYFACLILFIYFLTSEPKTKAWKKLLMYLGCVVAEAGILGWSSMSVKYDHITKTIVSTWHGVPVKILWVSIKPIASSSQNEEIIGRKWGIAQNCTKPKEQLTKQECDGKEPGDWGGGSSSSLWISTQAALHSLFWSK